MNNASPRTASAPLAANDPSPDRAESRACGAGAEDMTERHLRLLQDMAEHGAATVRSLSRRLVEAIEQERDDGAARLATAMTQASRMVRQCIALEGKIVEDRRKREDQEEAEPFRSDTGSDPP